MRAVRVGDVMPFDPGSIVSTFDGAVPEGYVRRIAPVPFDEFTRVAWIYPDGWAVELVFRGQDLQESRFLFPWDMRERYGEQALQGVPEATLRKLKAAMPPQLTREEWREE